MDLQRFLGQKLMLAFVGHEEIPETIRKAIVEYRPAGFTLFRSNNIDSPRQLRLLTGLLQKEAARVDLPPFLIGLDQEGGQLMAVGEATQLPGNMALGATGSEELSFKAGQVLGRELAAMGINLNYAPCVDVNTNPRNPVVGVRSFGEDPVEVARLVAAMIRGIQSEGVAATAKHFPGHGDVEVDSHVRMPVLNQTLEQLERNAFPPFRAAIENDCKLIMTAHLGLPAIDKNGIPATLSKAVMQGILREGMGYDGVIITDAMDMHAIRQGEALVDETASAVAAGADLLLMTASAEDHQRAYTGLQKALSENRISREAFIHSIERVFRLKEWINTAAKSYPLDVVDCEAHRQIADEIAERSITLVRDRKHWLPLKLNPDQRIAVILPQPQNLTPADTSAYLIPQLANEVRALHANTREFILPFNPDASCIAGILQQMADFDVILVGTINASIASGQAALVNALAALPQPVIVAAMRLPYDLAVFPQVESYLCTYGILQPSMRALAKALFGRIPFTGKLPVSLPGVD